MEKTSEKITKGPKRQERGKKKKTYETHMKKLKQQILENNKVPIPSPTDRPTPSISSSTCNSTLSTPSSTGNSTPSTPSSTGNSTLSTPSHITRSNDTYFYAIVILALLAIGV